MTEAKIPRWTPRLAQTVAPENQEALTGAKT
jgi:hypothetical protein